MGDKEHWQAVYEKKAPDKVSWYRRHLERSLEFIRSCDLETASRIVDVGGGASTLVDDLLIDGFDHVSVIDLSEAALAASKQRLGDHASKVDWIVGDVTTVLLPAGSVDMWHDRAVFHFLTEEKTRSAYLAQVMHCVKPGGHVLVATFALDGPQMCSGLPVVRYDSAGIHSMFGNAFEKVGATAEIHKTPWGGFQSFVYCCCRRAG